ncbi:MAG: metallophosphatase [Bacteroidaceae bacterium]|nr:metallophosphatase [Bacteroidaceae bacterium]
MKKQTIYKHSLLLTLLFLTLSLSAQKEVQLTILHTNDTHSQIEPITRRCNTSELSEKGGYIRRATLVDNYRAKDKDLLLMDCGDFSQGTPYYNLFRGEVEVRLMSAMKYDAVALGNHEFDFGLENILRLTKMASFPILCSNADFSKTILKDAIKPYTILHKKGLKIGVFALLPKLDGLVQVEKMKGIVYLDPIETSNKMAKMLKEEEHCDLVICLSHLGNRASSSKAMSDASLIKKTRNIDLVLGGHSHTFYIKPLFYNNLDGQEIANYQMGKSGAYVGKMILTLEK